MHDPHGLQTSDGKSTVDGRMSDKLYTVHEDNYLIYPSYCISILSKDGPLAMAHAGDLLNVFLKDQRRLRSMETCGTPPEKVCRFGSSGMMWDAAEPFQALLSLVYSWRMS